MFGVPGMLQGGPLFPLLSNKIYGGTVKIACEPGEKQGEALLKR